jgi:hypothetical protein
VSAELKASVRAALAGNLYIDESSPCTRTEDAVMRIAAAQLKAVALSMALASEEIDDGDDPEGWVMDKPFSRADALFAIGGIQSLLANAHTLLAESERDTATKSVESEAANG